MEKIKLCYELVITCIYISGVHVKEVYEVKADDLMDTLLENVYKGKFQKYNPTYTSTTKISSTSMIKTGKSETATTNLPQALTTHIVPLKKYAQNITIEQFRLRKRKIDLKTLMESGVKHIPNFNSNVDEINIQTRRFNNIQSTHPKENILREYYFSFQNGTIIYMRKNQTISLMAQFLYETRYHLPYSQLLRKKYNKNIKYQIGYCFSLLRTLKQQQMILYSTMKRNYERFMTLYIHIKLYEKIVKLDVDIKDLIKFILQLNKIRQKQADDKTTTTRPTTPPWG